MDNPPTHRHIPVRFKGCPQEHQDSPSERGNSKSKGRASAATSTPAANTPSRRPTKRARWASDDDEDGSGRGGRGGKGRKAHAENFACPFYIYNKVVHFNCRAAVLRNLSDVAWHIERAHLEPKAFCRRCWKDFQSRDQLVEHMGSPTRCHERPFPHYWARPEDLEAVRERRVRDRRPKATWQDIYNAIFANAQGRQPTFHSAHPQDVIDALANYRQSPFHQDLARSFDNQSLESFWLIFHDSLVNFLGGEQFAVYPRQTSNGNHHSDLHLGSSSSIQQTAVPQTAPAVFGDPAAGYLQAGLMGQGMFARMPTQASSGAFGSMDPSLLTGPHFDQYPGLGFPEPQAIHPQFTGHAQGSTYSPFAGQVAPSGLMPQPAPQVFGPNYPNLQSTLSQGFEMPSFTQALPPQPALQRQMSSSTARGSQATTPGVLTGPNPSQQGSDMGYRGAPASPLNPRKRRR